jgi:hypothetical protein
VTGIEPAYSAWEADVLPLNYTRETAEILRTTQFELERANHESVALTAATT